MKKVIWGGIAAVLTAWSSIAMAAGEVKLVHASSVVMTFKGLSQQSVNFTAAVKNLAPNKQVFAHYKAADGTWVDAPLSFKHSSGASNEVWSAGFVYPVGATADLQFALRYVVNGQTHWDNNGGKNYFIAKDGGEQLAPDLNVAVRSHSPTAVVDAGQTTVGGSVLLRNLSLVKDVKVHYTTDNWATTRVAPAEWSRFFYSGAGSSAQNPNAYDVDGWTYRLDIGNASQYEYAVQYTVNGQTFWDNNFGQNYRTTLIRQ